MCEKGELTRVGLGNEEEDDALLGSECRDVDILALLIFEHVRGETVADVDRSERSGLWMWG